MIKSVSKANQFGKVSLYLLSFKLSIKNDNKTFREEKTINKATFNYLTQFKANGY